MLNKFKKAVKDFVYDTDGTNNRKKEAIDEILPLLEEIESLWDNSLTRENIEQEKFKVQLEVLNICGSYDLLKFYYNGMYSMLVEAFKSIGETEEKASLLSLKRITVNIGLSLNNRELFMLYNALLNLNKVVNISELSRRNIYAENSQKIYNNLFLLSSFQKKYLDLFPFLGDLVDVDEVLGFGGSKIKILDKRALDYIDNAIELASKFRTELSLINARNITKK